MMLLLYRLNFVFQLRSRKHKSKEQPKIKAIFQIYLLYHGAKKQHLVIYKPKSLKSQCINYSCINIKAPCYHRATSPSCSNSCIANSWGISNSFGSSGSNKKENNEIIEYKDMFNYKIC
jgi:hypothetical protein